jgi:hypothetical protein
MASQTRTEVKTDKSEPSLQSKNALVIILDVLCVCVLCASNSMEDDLTFQCRARHGHHRGKSEPNKKRVTTSKQGRREKSKKKIEHVCAGNGVGNQKKRKSRAT